MSFKARKIFVALFAVLIALVSVAHAQESVVLKIKGQEGQILKYSGNVGGSLTFELDSLPFPGSKLSGENISVRVVADTYFDTTDAGDFGSSYIMKGMIRNIILGELLQLSEIGGIGSKSAPEFGIELAPNGAISNLEVLNFEIPESAGGFMQNALPGMDTMGMDLSSLDTILPIITGLIPPMFPDDPVMPGDTWTQSISQEDMPMPIFPILKFEYKLVSIEQGIANMEFIAVGDYDAGFLNNFLSMLPEIPMGEDIMTIDNVDLKMKWDLKGTMSLEIEPGTIEALDIKGKVALKGDANMTFTHPDGSSDKWKPSMQGSVSLDGALKYEGDVTREELDVLFPPQEDEDEVDSDELTD
ncbi:MAG TPA: hypothetical protein PLN69_10470 [bacterium]|nr:hypothetical protein [bacterium]